MPNSDHALVNFEEDYELNYILKKYGKKETASNRTTLNTLGSACKTSLGKYSITHAEFYAYLEAAARLDSLD